MAYMRGDWYVYSCEAHMHISHGGEKGPVGSVTMPIDKFDELVVMRWHRLSRDEQIAAEDRCLVEYEGNFGLDGLRAARGLPSLMDEIHEWLPPQPPEKPVAHAEPTRWDRTRKRVKIALTGVFPSAVVGLAASLVELVTLGFYVPGWEFKFALWNARRKMSQR